MQTDPYIWRWRLRMGAILIAAIVCAGILWAICTDCMTGNLPISRVQQLAALGLGLALIQFALHIRLRFKDQPELQATSRA